MKEKDKLLVTTNFSLSLFFFFFFFPFKSINISPFLAHLKFLSVNFFDFRRSKICRLTMVRYLYRWELDKACELSHRYEPLACEITKFFCIRVYSIGMNVLLARLFSEKIRGIAIA